jgi:tRNA G10  N-methylase Trm11
MRKISDAQLALLRLPPIVKHPAKYSHELRPHLRYLLRDARRILDPFAGTGLIHQLRWFNKTFGTEIEPEWAAIDPRTTLGNALDLRWSDGFFDAICTSPCYGNRLRDNYDAHDRLERLGYRHALGRPLHPDNAGTLAFGPGYQEFHQAVWCEASRVLQAGGIFVLNVKDYFENHERQHVTDWHIATLECLGYGLIEHVKVRVKGYRRGTDTERMDYESVLKFRKAVR